eukprot:scaffold42846_cov27-Tisochrysis_lutea.AAC.1
MAAVDCAHLANIWQPGCACLARCDAPQPSSRPQVPKRDRARVIAECEVWPVERHCTRQEVTLGRVGAEGVVERAQVRLASCTRDTRSHPHCHQPAEVNWLAGGRHLGPVRGVFTIEACERGSPAHGLTELGAARRGTCQVSR